MTPKMYYYLSPSILYQPWICLNNGSCDKYMYGYVLLELCLYMNKLKNLQNGLLETKNSKICLFRCQVTLKSKLSTVSTFLKYTIYYVKIHIKY